MGALAGAKIGVADMAANLVPVTLGNMLGGAAGVAGIYWLIYLRDRRSRDTGIGDR